MRIAVISDIHGNDVAFQAALADLAGESIDAGVCLGDAIQGGPEPDRVVARLRDIGWPVVMGNADAWLLSGVETGAENPSPERYARMLAVRDWSLSRLSEADRAWIAGFAPTVSLPLDGGRGLLAFHGSPASFDDLILPGTPQEDFERLLAPHAPRVMTGGHVHLQFVRHLGRTFHFNPGSVGLAYRHDQDKETPRLDAWAEYAVLDSRGERLALEFRRVPYPVEDLVRAFENSGRPHAGEMIAAYRR
jgi:predicted phosphodiesterase